MVVTQRLKKFDRSWRYVAEKDVPYYWINDEIITGEVLDDFISFCVIWSVRKFGEVHGVDIPEIDWDWNHHELRHAGMLGLYDSEDNTITLRIKGHRTFYNLAKTIVHEYIHYLQPRVGNWYDRHHRKYGYDDNPYEIEAYYLADLYGSECARWSMHQTELTNKRKEYADGL
jgi:hypothetical protein